MNSFNDFISWLRNKVHTGAEDFYYDFFGFDFSDPKVSRNIILRNDFPSKRFDELKSGLLREYFEACYVSFLEKYKHISTYELLNTIADLLKTSDESFSNKHCSFLARYLKLNLYEYEFQILPIDVTAKYVYEYFYLEMTKDISEELKLEASSNMVDDKFEFMNEVMAKHGIVSDQAFSVIERLANQGNAYAIYALGDIAYYGRQSNNDRDFQKAYFWFERNAKLKKNHAINYWSLGYICYWYKHEKRELRNAHIKQLEHLTREERLNLSIYYIDQSIFYGYAGGYNLLGLISADQSISIQFKHKHFGHRTKQSADATIDDMNALVDSEYYFTKAMNMGYNYAYNNFAFLYADLIENQRGLNPTVIYEYSKKFIELIKKSADSHEPWASNRYGLILLGKPVRNILYEVEVNEQEAYRYFKQAIDQHYGPGYHWALINMVNYFYIPDKVSAREDFTLEAIALMVENIIGVTNDQNILKECQSILEFILDQEKSLVMEKMT